MKKIFGQIKERILDLFYIVQKKDVVQITKLEREMPYMNKPISDATEDEIGMNVYVDYLESAIEKGADMIAVVSGFGTGKSSLIELLKEKYHGWSIWQNHRCERVYCQINLWSQLENSKENCIELHRAFLYQVIGSVYPYKGSYFSRRTGRNYGMFKISAENPFWNAIINIAVVVLALVAVVHYFSEEIISSGIFSDKVLNAGILIGYLFCAIVVFLLLVRTEILFSSGGTQGERQIEENELIDLYKEHILRPKDWIRRIEAFWGTRKHIVVVIEDLDRTQGGDKVYEFLKEIRKYYVPSDQVEKYFLNHVTFIVSIMPEDKLREQCEQEKLDDNYVYDKLFDYTVNLNRINIDNFDAVLEALILEKRTEFEQIGIEIHDTDNVHKIPGMQWIIYEKNLSLRQVKERLNDSIVVYESIREKFGADSPEFAKCAAVAYLRSAFSQNFYGILDKQLEEMLTYYAKEFPDSSTFVNKYWNCEDVKEKEFYETIYRMMDSHLIDENYRTYFFNYPKSSHLYNIQQNRVRNLIVYNENISEDLKRDVVEVADDRIDVIISAMKKATELVGQLPQCIIYSPELWGIANQHFNQYLLNLISKNFSNIKEVLPEHYTMLESAISMENCSTILCDAILNNDLVVVNALRTYILDKHIEKISSYIELFRVPFATLKSDELQKMKEVPLDNILLMTKGVVGELDEDVIDGICKRIRANKEITKLVISEDFYVELANSFGITEVLDEVVEYLKSRMVLQPELEDMIYEGITNGTISKGVYFELINAVDEDTLEHKQMDRIECLNEPGMISESVCNMLYEGGYSKTYLLNMIEKYDSRIDMFKEEYFHVMVKNGKVIFEEYPKLFHKIRVWGCEKFRDEMIELKDFFMEPYPLLTTSEVRYMTAPDVVFQLYDTSRAAEDEGDAFIEFANRQFRKSNIAYEMFQFVATMDEEVIPIVFYKLNMQKVRFSVMSAAKKLQIVEKLRVSLDLSNSNEAIKFMDYTECLIPELETEILPDLKKNGNDDLCKAYIKAIQKSGKLTKYTVRYLRALPTIYIYGDMINEEMYRKRYYTYYVCSKNMEQKKFTIEYDKLDVLWNVYIEIFRSTKGYKNTRNYMQECKEFLKLVQNRNAYTELPEDSRMAMASISQDENILLDVLGYSDEFVVEYFSKIDSFSSKTAAETFVNIMEKHEKYAQKKTIYDNVYAKLQNPSLKSKYTRLYNRANS